MILPRRHDWRLPDALPADRTPSTPDTTTPRRPPAVPHGLARDSPCTWSKAPGSVRGAVRLSPSAAISGTLVEFERRTLRTAHVARSPAPARFRVCSLPARCSSRIAVRCAWLNMRSCSCRFFRHAAEFLLNAHFRSVPCGLLLLAVQSIAGRASASRRCARFTMATTISRSRNSSLRRRRRGFRALAAAF